jgi:predicted TPR repeat methyltransferase
MLAVADEKNLYDELHAAEICDFLGSLPDQLCFDLVLAGDVFAYTGDLDRLFEGVRRNISDDGVFAFTTEHADGGGYVLESTGRYGHDDSYIRNLAAFRNFDIVGHDERTIRVENGEPVIGFVFLLKPC